MAAAGRNPPPYATPTNSMKRSRTSEAVIDGEDRISALPDALILHVFSFLEIEDVVMTGALSRRWYSLWTKASAVTIKMESVEDFSRVERFFLLCTSPVIRKLHLCLRYNGDYNFDHWIRFAVGRGIEHLCMELCNEDDYDYVLPLALFRCKSLKWLKLESCEFPDKLLTLNGDFMGISWSLLKVLRLHEMKVVDGMIKMVLEGSPMLESLTIENCYGMHNIRICSKNMEELVIRGYNPYCIEEDDPNLENMCLEIYAPYLSSLRLLGYWWEKEVIVLKGVHPLVEVELDFYGTDSDIIYGTMKRILNKLLLVDKLVIGNEILKYLPSGRISLVFPMAHFQHLNNKGDSSLQLNCRSLTLTTSADQYSLGQIARALEIAPNVEKLVIHFSHETSPRDSFFDSEILRGKSWKSWISRIKNIEITGFSSHRFVKPSYWLPLIEALLRDACVLEKMVINVKWSWTSGRKILEEAHAEDVLEVGEVILGYRRGSKAAEVILNYPGKRKKSVV